MKILLLTLAITAAWAAESWPQFRGNNASGVSTSFEKIPLRSTRGSMACGVMVACPGWRSMAP